jgi:hypothetical protein
VCVCCHVSCRDGDRYWGLSLVSYNNVVGFFQLLMIGMRYSGAKGYSSFNGFLNVMFQVCVVVFFSPGPCILCRNW